MITEKFLFWFCAIGIIYPYLAYPLFIKLLKMISPPALYRAYDDELPAVTIVIYAQNAEKRINQKISNCFALDYPSNKLEIVVVSDGSTDRTNAIVKSFREHGVKLLEFPRPRGRIQAMNDSIKFCDTELVAFTDINVDFRQDTLRYVIRYLADKRVGAVSANVIHTLSKHEQAESLNTFYWRIDNDLKQTEGERGCLMEINRGLFAMKKDLYQRIPYNIITEQEYIACDLIERGHLVVYDEKARCTNEYDLPFELNAKRRTIYGAGHFQILGTFVGMLNLIDGFGSLVFFSRNFLRWMGPFFLLGLFVANFLLALDGIVYYRVFLLQCTFYVCAILGMFFRKMGLEVMLLNICHDFVEFNRNYIAGLLIYAGSPKIHRIKKH